MNTGKAIIDGIISGRLMHAPCVQDKKHTCLVVWSGGAAEQLEAIVNEALQQHGAASLPAADPTEPGKTDLNP